MQALLHAEQETGCEGTFRPSANYTAAVGYAALRARMFTKIFPTILVLTLLFWSHPLLAPPSSAASDSIEWKTFFVANLGTRVDYPARIFSVPKGEPEVGIG